MAFDLKSEVMEVNPVLAGEWLQKPAKNRGLRVTTVNRYAADMSAGKWQLTHQGIAFNSKGELIDGQHRLKAIVQSGMVIPLMVTQHVDAIMNVDSHAPRSVADRISIFSGKKCHPRITAAANAIRDFSSLNSGVRLQGLTTNQMYDFVTEHWEALDFVATAFGSMSKLSSAPVMAATARAYYHVDRQRLEEFVRVLQTGIPNDSKEDSAALRLRDYLLTASGSGCYRAIRVERYQKTQSAIVAFCSRTHVRLLRSRREAFPLPGEI